jgi:hypothetical protein
MRRGGLGLFDAERRPATRPRSSSARAACGLHVREDGFLRAGGDDRGREPRDVDVSSPSAPPPLLDRQHRDDVVRSHEPSVPERHHADVSSSHEIFFAHVHIVANMRSFSAPPIIETACVRIAAVNARPRPNRCRHGASCPLIKEGRGDLSVPVADPLSERTHSCRGNGRQQRTHGAAHAGGSGR